MGCDVVRIKTKLLLGDMLLVFMFGSFVIAAAYLLLYYLK